ncbi:universal stress protein [Natronococcus occultus]|uniref:Universal stress protein UspA-like protein n=1 Tax=Natronococcus occultus SP4 TaxID=694430 RepID=L0K4V5_9EURY|nr:universal stress protein [Natronococcus occultus]AGB39389.1 universal stress protein UspA-like protein [Natronococcus occultus SP4]
MFDRILVPVDGSEHSRRALTTAATEFETDEIVALHVLDPFRVASTTEEAVWNSDYMDEREREAEELLAEYAELGREFDVPIRTELAKGSPARAIVGAVGDFDVDHVVVGSRGRSGIGRVLLGSVAENVARRAPVSVTIVREE